MTPNIQKSIARLRECVAENAVPAYQADDILAVCAAVEEAETMVKRLNSKIVNLQAACGVEKHRAEAAESRLNKTDGELTAAYLAGFHKRDDAVRDLQARVKELELINVKGQRPPT